jgi:MFS family permease
MLTLGLGVPLGGILSDRSGRRDTVIAISLAVTAICMPLLISVPQSLLMPAYGIVGLVMGIAAGPIMTTPAQVLPPPARAVGMGLFWTVYYAVMMFAPSLAGQIADRFSDASTAYWLGAGGLVFCLLCLGLFRQLTPSASHTT